MNQPTDSDFEISVPEASAPEVPAPEALKPPPEAVPAPGVDAMTEPVPVEPSPEEPPIERHDPFAYMRNAPWMNRKLSPSGRAAILLRRDLEAFPVIEGRDPNHADLDAIVKRTVDYIVPIIKRERATDYAYDVLEEKRQTRIAEKRASTNDVLQAGLVKVSGGTMPQQMRDASAESDAQVDVGPLLAQLGPEARNERIHSQKWSDPTDDGDYLKSLEEYRGRKVRLPDGSLVPDPYSPTGSLMSPVDDLRDVARAGRVAGKTVLTGLVGTMSPRTTAPSAAALGQAYEQTRVAIGQGGEFDYQRKAALGGKDGFVQLRQFRNVSNFNVGLYMQQAKVPLDWTLRIAGRYARNNSSNYRPDEPYGLDPQTREFIEHGYAVGKSGIFD